MENLQITKIESASSLEALNRSEIDIQIATAKQYPRNVEDSLNRIVSLGAVSPKTAEECFYSLRRGGEGGTAIEGPSVRLAEIVAASWGNLRVASQIVGNDGKFITARGVCHDLETNVAVACEVRRRITDKYGKTYNDDMQVVTGNAAGAIAFRNAVFKVVPKAVIGEAIDQIKGRLTEGVAKDFESSKEKMFNYFAKLGVTKEMLYNYFDIKDESEVTPEIVAELRTTVTSIKERQATVEDLFINPYNEKMKVKKTEKTKGSVQDRLAKAMAAQNGGSDVSMTVASEMNDDLPFDD